MNVITSIVAATLLIGSVAFNNAFATQETSTDHQCEDSIDESVEDSVEASVEDVEDSVEESLDSNVEQDLIGRIDATGCFFNVHTWEGKQSIRHAQLPCSCFANQTKVSAASFYFCQ